LNSQPSSVSTQNAAFDYIRPSGLAFEDKRCLGVYHNLANLDICVLRHKRHTPHVVTVINLR
jgi:hypothetical protein